MVNGIIIIADLISSCFPEYVVVSTYFIVPLFDGYKTEANSSGHGWHGDFEVSVFIQHGSV